MELLKEIEERLSILRNLYDSLRIVDPIDKKVITVNNDAIKYMEGSCYDFWNKNKFCDNCVSIRAYIQNDTCVKLQCRDNSVFVVIATPVCYKSTTYVLELLKDITRNAGRSQIVVSNIGNVNLLLKEMENRIMQNDLIIEIDKDLCRAKGPGKNTTMK